MLSTEVVFDPHLQRRGVVRRLAAGAGFREVAFSGDAVACTIHLERPRRP